MRHVLGFLLLVTFALAAVPGAPAEDKGLGFLDKPPVFIGSDPDFPLSMFGAELAPKGKIVPDFDYSSVRSESFQSGGVSVQPGLDVELTTARVSAFTGISDAWTAALSIPWEESRISGTIGGLPATRTVQGISNIALIGKRLLWRQNETDSVVGSFGIELPTGPSSTSFNQTNSVTTAYYGVPRIPLSWQPSTGTWNFYLAATYRGQRGQISYAAMAAGKIFSAGDQDVKIGNILILAGNVTYGITRDIAVALGLTYRNQGDDSYPNAPPPGISQPALAGTTTHGAMVTLDPSVRVKVLNRVVVGVGFRTPIIKPDNGMVPDDRVYFIVYPVP